MTLSIIIKDGQMASIRSAEEFNEYLNTSIDAIELSAYTIDGMQALKFLGRKKVDLILLDYEMPEADGPQVLGMLREDPELAGIPVVFLTGVNSPESIERLLSLNPLGYILKNTTRDNLCDSLKGFFEKI
jgi:CheY-like chemotaxis protein